jgi:hypothetical protein
MSQGAAFRTAWQAELAAAPAWQRDRMVQAQDELDRQAEAQRVQEERQRNAQEQRQEAQRAWGARHRELQAVEKVAQDELRLARSRLATDDPVIRREAAFALSGLEHLAEQAATDLRAWKQTAPP